MADTWIQGSFAFRCTIAESALMAEAIDAGHDLCADMDPEPPSAALLAVFPPTDMADAWSGFRYAFADPDFPTVGGDLTSEPCPADPSACIARFSGMVDFDSEAIATVIQRCCGETLAKRPIGFEWAVTCSRPRAGEFGGGWCAVHPDRIEFGTTGELLAARSKAALSSRDLWPRAVAVMAPARGFQPKAVAAAFHETREAKTARAGIRCGAMSPSPPSARFGNRTMHSPGSCADMARQWLFAASIPRHRAFSLPPALAAVLAPIAGAFTGL